MFGTYHRVKFIIALGVTGCTLMAVGEHELWLSTHFARTEARIESVEQSCAEGRHGPLHYVPCDAALPGADRRAVIGLRYVSPADGREHRGAIRCDTRMEETPDLRAGQTFSILAHRSDPDLIQRAKCTFLDPGAPRG